MVKAQGSGDGRGPDTAVCLPKGESLGGSLTWRNKVGAAVGAVPMSGCLLQLPPSQEHGGKDLLPTGVFVKGEVSLLEVFSNG